MVFVVHVLAPKLTWHLPPFRRFYSQKCHLPKRLAAWTLRRRLKLRYSWRKPSQWPRPRFVQSSPRNRISLFTTRPPVSRKQRSYFLETGHFCNTRTHTHILRTEFTHAQFLGHRVNLQQTPFAAKHFTLRVVYIKISQEVMLRHVMSCHVMSCCVTCSYAVSCYDAMSCHVRYFMSCHVMTIDVVFCRFLSRYVAWCHVMSGIFIPRHVMLCDVMLCHLMSRCVTLCRLCHAMSCHVRYYDIVSCHVRWCDFIVCQV